MEKVKSNIKSKYISIFTWIINNQKIADQITFGLSLGEEFDLAIKSNKSINNDEIS